MFESLYTGFFENLGRLNETMLDIVAFHDSNPAAFYLFTFFVAVPFVIVLSVSTISNYYECKNYECDDEEQGV